MLHAFSPAFVEESQNCINDFDSFAIAGDFNIHIDNAEIKFSKEIITV